MSILLLNKIKKKKNTDIIKPVDFFVNCFLGNLIKTGNRNKAYVFYVKLIARLKKDFPNKDPIDVLINSFNLMKPLVNLRVKKVAGISYQLPCPIDEIKSFKVSMKWFFGSLKLRKEKGIYNKMRSEILDVLNGKGLTLQRKYFHEKVVLDNRAFLFFLKK